MKTNEYYDGDRTEPKRRQETRTRTTAIVLIMSTVISLVFLVYAFGQKSEADRLRSELEACQAHHEVSR